MPKWSMRHNISGHPMPPVMQLLICARAERAAARLVSRAYIFLAHSAATRVGDPAVVPVSALDQVGDIHECEAGLVREARAVGLHHCLLDARLEREPPNQLRAALHKSREAVGVLLT